MYPHEYQKLVKPHKAIFMQLYDSTSSLPLYLEKANDLVIKTLQRQSASSVQRAKIANIQTIALLDVVLRYEFFPLGDYSTFANTKKYETFIEACKTNLILYSQSLPISTLVTTLIMLYMVHRWEQDQQHCYRIDPMLAWKLRAVSLQKMPTEFLKLPFKGIYLETPKEAPFMMHMDTREAASPIQGLFITEERNALKCMVITEPTSGIEYDFGYAHWRITLDKPTLEESINESLIYAEKHSTANFDFKKAEPAIRKIFNYVINVILYVTHPDTEHENFNDSPEFRSLYARAIKQTGAKRRKLLDRANKVRGNNLIVIGRGTKCSQTEIEAIKGSKRILNKRSYVAAHWQHFWVGKGRTERKYMLRKSFWRGQGVVTPTTHVVK